METIAHVAFRVLGKFGGACRRMLKEPQKVRIGKYHFLRFRIFNVSLFICMRPYVKSGSELVIAERAFCLISILT